MNPEVYNKLKDQCETGATLGDIARRLGVSRQRVHQLLKKVPELEVTRKKVRQDIKQADYYGSIIRKRKALYGYMTADEFNADVLRQEQGYRLRNKRNSAMRDGHVFELTWDDLKWPTHCPILGIELDYFGESGQRSNHSISFDRLDPSQGYIPGNVYIVSWRANRIKNDGTAEEHRRIADWMEYASEYEVVKPCVSSDS